MSVKLSKIKVVIVLVLLAAAAYYYLLTNATQAFVFGINYKIHQCLTSGYPLRQALAGPSRVSLASGESPATTEVLCFQTSKCSIRGRLPHKR